jgi:hypothetical protein
MNQALLRLVQQHLFTVLVELNRVDLNRANLPALARSVAGLAARQSNNGNTPTKFAPASPEKSRR